MVIFQFADCKRLLQITVEIERSIEKIGPAQFLAWETKAKPQHGSLNSGSLN